MDDGFFKMVFHLSTPIPETQGFCTGYELGEWRFEQLVEYIFDEYLLEFCLAHSECHNVNYKNAKQKLREAFKNVYTYRERKLKDNGEEEKNSRGEFGELLLHAIIREYHNTLPEISKLYYKDGPNEVVKGFDAVHVVLLDGSLELWLGEAKFYSDATKAMYEALKSVDEHLNRDYLRGEFAAIIRKINHDWPYASQLKKLIDSRVTLDQIFKSICIPVLITYNSEVVNRHDICCEEYLDEIFHEINKHQQYFSDKLLKKGNIKVKVNLFFMPLKDKDKLVRFVDKAIEAGQK